MKDQLNRTIELKNTPTRIVSLVPSQTELLYDLGLESSIVGITKFCVHPHHLLSNITVVGGTKQVHFDKIKALSPDVILCNKEENTQDMIAELEKIAPVHLSDIYHVEDCLELISMYGFMFSVENKAEGIISIIKKEQQKFQDFIKDFPKLKTAYFIWKNPWMVAANNNFIDALLTVGKFDNYFGNLDRYPEVDLENDLGDDVEVIMLSTEPFPFKEAHVETMKKKFPKAKVLLVDGELFSWYGSRLAKSFQYFKSLRLESLN
ncbi:ABC transporter substrate-binding protein [Xanthomarina sp. F2636L]|uniref:ABC transporter substrate-binding protein n=1 Tax=Xanthomarina sp. F2636L TaxID=2996018 RepID=UPI00225E22AC|nr:helical backbone metal receptor [Xanthomarina sp. F2636L]MCX7551943.1 helical backbone metal receptor [Xanthomarina sp. F2636L]